MATSNCVSDNSTWTRVAGAISYTENKISKSITRVSQSSEFLSPFLSFLLLQGGPVLFGAGITRHTLQRQRPQLQHCLSSLLLRAQ